MERWRLLKAKHNCVMMLLGNGEARRCNAISQIRRKVQLVEFPREPHNKFVSFGDGIKGAHEF